MALTNDEVLALKAHCGYNVVGIGAEFYSSLEGYVALFDRAIQPYLIDLSTTSSTMVASSPTGTTVPITFASNPTVVGNNVQPLAFALGTKLVVDVGPNQELTQIQFLSGLVATVLLTNSHGVAGPYLVEPQGAEYRVRRYLTRLDTIDAQLDTFAPLLAGIQEAVGDAKFYANERGGRKGKTLDKAGSLIDQREQTRRDLCGLLGIPYLPDLKNGGGRAVGGGLTAS